MRICFVLLAAVVLTACAAMALEPHDNGWRIAIPTREIDVQAIVIGHGALCDCHHTLWHGGSVKVEASCKAVQVGDIAYLYSTEGDTLVLECVQITSIPDECIDHDGDVLVVDGDLLYRYIIL